MTRIPTPAGIINVRSFPGTVPVLVAAHGFTQHGGMYAELASLLPNAVDAVDLPGHGATTVEPSLENAVASLHLALERQTAPRALIGYSQGGRMALLAALERPDLVDSLVLIGVSLGIRDGDERERRRAADELLATEIRDVGVSRFLDRWLDAPMFKGLKERDRRWRGTDRSLREENTSAGLAAALETMGQGAQPYVGNRLTELAMPVLFLLGGDDEPNITSTTALAPSMLDARVRVVERAGHALVGEQPAEVAMLIDEFVNG